MSKSITLKRELAIVRFTSGIALERSSKQATGGTASVVNNEQDIFDLLVQESITMGPRRSEAVSKVANNIGRNPRTLTASTPLGSCSRSPGELAL